MEREPPVEDAAEGRLRESARRYRGLLEGSRNVVFRVAESGAISFLSRAFEALSGWPAHEWIGRPFTDLLAEDEREAAAASLRRLLGGEVPPPFDVRLQVRGGEAHRVLEVTLLPQDHEGRIVGAIGAATDVTERRQQEQALRRAEGQLRHLVESIHAILWRADAATQRFAFVSREAEALLGYPLQYWREDPRFWQEHVHPEDRAWAIAARARAAEERRDYEAEYRMIAADGRVLWLRDVVRVRSVPGAGAEMLGITVDVTERRQAEEDLRRSREQLSDLNAHLDWVREEERAGIAREIHDELGQALTALRMDVAWLRNRLLEGEAAPAREAQLAKLRGMTELIDETIARARRISSELRPGVLDDLGLEAAVEWHAQEVERRTGLRCAVRSELPGARLDRDLSTALFRILQESLTNVVRHAQASRVDVTLRQEGGRVVLEVSDDGLGLPQGPGPRRTLGLLGMKERARRLGGTVVVASAPGAGTTVQASIPLPGPPPPPGGPDPEPVPS